MLIGIAVSIFLVSYLFLISEKIPRAVIAVFGATLRLVERSRRAGSCSWEPGPGPAVLFQRRLDDRYGARKRADHRQVLKVIGHKRKPHGKEVSKAQRRKEGQQKKRHGHKRSGPPPRPRLP